MANDSDTGRLPAPTALPRTALFDRELRLFASDAGEQRVRRPLDAITAVLAFGLLELLGWWAQPTRDFEQALNDAVTSSPGWLRNFWVITSDVIVLMAAAALAATIVRRRWPLLIQCLVSLASATGLVMLLAWQTGNDLPSIDQVIGGSNEVSWPAAAICLSAATLLALAADVTAPARRAGTWAILIVSAAAVLAGHTIPTGAVAALLAAVCAAALGRLVAGTAAGRVSRREVLELLAAVGVSDVKIAGFSRQGDGVVLIEAISEREGPLLVKVLGRDVAEQRRALRLWRSLIYRDGGAAFAVARSPGLTRETVATLLADVRGVPVWRVVTAGQPGGSDEVLALAADGHRAQALAPGELPRERMAAAWSTVQTMHQARIAHLRIGPRSLVLRPDGVALTDFIDAMPAADRERILTDDAQLLVLLAALVDPAAAIDAAGAAVGRDELAEMLPYLQAAALPGDLRALVKAAGLDIDELRKLAAAAAGVDVPELAALRRVTPWSLITSGLLVLAASAIISFFSGLDWADLRDAFRTASVPLLVAGFVVAQLPRMTQALATLGSVPARLPYLPVYMMELATCFMNVALPSAAARMALTVRFFQRQGVAAATAVTSGLVSSFISNVMQAILLGALLLFSQLSLNLNTSSSSSDSGKQDLFKLIGLVCILTVAVFLASGRLRRLVAGRIRRWWPDVRAAAQPLRDPQKLFQLLGGSFATEILFAAALCLFVHAFGGDLSLVEVLFVNLTASLVAIVIPVPGGIGVTESALIFGLTSLGLDQDVAFASTITYRISTFYLPPTWGWVAMQWLTRKGLL